jgi:cholesterol transport system auxiliary component
MFLRQGLMLAGLALVLAGCGGGAPAETFDLSAAREIRRGAVSGQLVVAEPTGLQFYDSDRIVVRDGAAITYLKGAQWSDRLPKLVQARLVQSFENVMRVGAVGRTGERIAADRQINIEIRAFEIEKPWLSCRRSFWPSAAGGLSQALLLRRGCLSGQSMVQPPALGLIRR